MKVMIVEDEILVRLGLRKAIPWTSLGMELVCEAKDGAEAYEMFKQHLPDIVLVDIELPKMDGLKFIRFAKSHRSESRFIVLTCHQDMKYTREAIQLQVSDFLLKSTLDMKELCDILQNISFAMAVERGDAEKKKLLSIPVDLTMQEFMRNWQSGAMDSNQIRHQLARMGMAEAGRYQACVLQLDLESESPPMSQDDSPFMIGGVEDAGNRRWHFILSGDSAQPQLLHWLRAIAGRAGMPVTLAVSAPFSEPHEWALNDRKAAEILQHHYYDEESGIYFAGNQLHEIQEAMPPAVQKLKKDIFDCIESLQFAAAKQKIRDMQDELKRLPRLHPSVVKNMLTEFLFRTWTACEELEGGKQTANHQLVDQLYTTRRLVQTVSLIIQEMDRFSSLTHTLEDKSKIIVLITQYIKTHLQQEITLQEVADTFYISSNYLSRLFKEVSSMSFTEFVLYEKTELAIVMMKNGKSLTEISEKLGYLNLSSFTRMFKKVRGASPSRYLDSV